MAALKRFAGPALVPNADTTLLTVPAGKRWTVKQILMANTDAVQHPLTIGIGGVAATNQILPNSNIAGSTASAYNLTLPLEAGESLHAICPSGALAVTVSGVEQDA